MLQILNPAQKAWQTRRLLAEQRAKAEAVKVAVAAAPVKKQPANSPVVEINLDRADVGSGWRRWVVLDVGKAWVKLFNASTLLAIEVRRDQFDAGARPVKFDRAKVVEIIKRNIAMADRVNGEAEKIVLPDGGADAVKAMEMMA